MQFTYHIRLQTTVLYHSILILTGNLHFITAKTILHKTITQSSRHGNTPILTTSASASTGHKQM